MKCQILISRKNKKNISKCRLLKVLPSIQSANKTPWIRKPKNCEQSLSWPGCLFYCQVRAFVIDTHDIIWATPSESVSSGHVQTAMAQIRLCRRTVWSGPSLSANRIITLGYYRIYKWRAKARMILCACAEWSECAFCASSKAYFYFMRPVLESVYRINHTYSNNHRLVNSSYHTFPKFSERPDWANSIDPPQNGAWSGSTLLPLCSNFQTYRSVVKWICSNFRTGTVSQ